MKARLLLLCAVLAFMPATRVLAGFDAFLKMDPIQGESTASGHSNEMVVLSFSFNLTNNGGILTIQDLTITKPLDKASPTLYLGCCVGTHYPTAILSMRKAGTNQTDYLKYTLTDVIISSVKPGGTGLQDDRPTESVTLNFQSIQWLYQPLDTNGAASGPAIVTAFSRGPGG